MRMHVQQTIQNTRRNQMSESSKFTRSNPQRLGMKLDHFVLHWKMLQVLT